MGRVSPKTQKEEKQHEKDLCRNRLEIHATACFELDDPGSLILGKQGFLLRSGNGTGADQAFQAGSSRREVMLPWRGFNYMWTATLTEPADAAFTLAKEVHPNWINLSKGTRKLMARNAHILLGRDLLHPVTFALCFSRAGNIVGGTGHAIRLAGKSSIPVFNLGTFGDVVTYEMIDELSMFLNRFGATLPLVA